MSGKARRESDDFTMGVRIVYENNGERYIVTKSVHCTKENDWSYNANTDVQHTIGNEDNFIMDKDEKAEIIRKLIPYDMENTLYCKASRWSALLIFQPSQVWRTRLMHLLT